jgi:outer membrane protein assembly factor BamE
MPTMPHRLRPPAAALLASTLALAGCESLQSSDNLLGVVTPYRVEVVQGNVVTKEQAALIKPNMSRAQVRDILGSPLLTDAFHADRWDYVFTIRRQGAEPQRRRIVVRFDGEKLKSMDAGDDLPAEREFIASIDTAKLSRRTDQGAAGAAEAGRLGRRARGTDADLPAAGSDEVSAAPGRPKPANVPSGNRPRRAAGEGPTA